VAQRVARRLALPASVRGPLPARPFRRLAAARFALLTTRRRWPARPKQPARRSS
jgi:hypothetical protein